jgi:hypothetical protein
MIAEVNKLDFRPHDIREQMEAGIFAFVFCLEYMVIQERIERVEK